MKKNKDVIKFINKTKKKTKYHWEKEGEEFIQKIESKKFDKNELKNILVTLIITEDIPRDFVSKLWIACTQIKQKIENNKGQYQKLIKAFDILIKNKHPLYLFLEGKISMDLNRSFDNNIAKYTDENIKQLRNILYAFTVRNVSLNYCQGFNTIVAFILQMTKYKEEESYYLFLILMEELLPYEHYLFGIGIEAEIPIILELLEKYEPELIYHCSKMDGFDLDIYSLLSQFITSFFTFKMDPDITIFFFTCMFGFYYLEENRKNIFYYFYKIILAIFRTFKSEILKCKNNKLFSELLDMEKLSKEKIQCIKYYTLFDESFDISIAKKIREKNIDKIIEKKKIKFKHNNAQNLECNINYPICLEEGNMESKLYLNNFYCKGVEIKNKNQNNIINIENEDENILRDIIIERRNHYCQVKSIKKKYNYTWEKEGKEIFLQINQNNPDNLDKKKLKEILSILLIKENIPNNLIPNLWQLCTKLQEIINNNKGQYNKLLKAFDLLIKNKHPFYLYIQQKIAKDLNRTFSHDEEFTKHVESLKNILQAFTVRNASLNYCQGLNTIVGYLLKIMDFKEEETFYLFLILMENILPYDYYLFGIGVEVEMVIVEKLLNKYVSDVMKHMDELNSTLILIGIFTQFITSLFTFKMNINITNLFFNCIFGFYLLEENKENLFFYFYKIILAIFKIYRNDILGINDMENINDILNFEKKLPKEYLENIIFYTLFESDNVFDLNEAKNLRKDLINKLLETKKTNFNFKNEEKIKCNLNYPLCVEEFNFPSPIQLKVSYEKIKKEGEEDNNKNEIIDEDSEENIFKDIIVERKKHYCQK